MTREEAIEHGKEQLEIFGGEHREFIEMAIKALDQEPSGNAINRQAVLDLFNKSSEYSWEMSLLRKKIEKMPSVTPQEPFINKPCVSSGVCEHDKNKVLDKIRAEIEALPKTYPFTNHIDTYVKEKDVEDIIDKYKSEIEPQESEEV